jgi:hypothetical protein
MKIEGFGNRLNNLHSESGGYQLGTRVTSNSFRKTAGVTSGDRNVDSGFNMDVVSN